MKSAKFIKDYDCEAMFEIKVEYKGDSYLLIFGKHINGYFCCMPMFGIGCQMSEPNDVHYNSHMLEGQCDFDEDTAFAIANAISKYSCNDF